MNPLITLNSSVDISRFSLRFAHFRRQSKIWFLESRKEAILRSYEFQRDQIGDHNNYLLAM